MPYDIEGAFQNPNVHSRKKSIGLIIAIKNGAS